MKRLIVLFTLLVAFKVQAQVEVITDPSVDALENARITKRKSNGNQVNGYRIMVGFYSGRDEAGSKLNEAKGYFGDMYNCTMLYDEPNFKVYVGEFTSKADADAALVQIRKRYSGARIVSDMVPAQRVH